jgi:hypothetical protein
MTYLPPHACFFEERDVGIHNVYKKICVRRFRIIMHIYTITFYFALCALQQNKSNEQSLNSKYFYNIQSEHINRTAICLLFPGLSIFTSFSLAKIYLYIGEGKFNLICYWLVYCLIWHLIWSRSFIYVIIRCVDIMFSTRQSVRSPSVRPCVSCRKDSSYFCRSLGSCQ